jgi:hypothetical protein
MKALLLLLTLSLSVSAFAMGEAHDGDGLCLEGRGVPAQTTSGGDSTSTGASTEK